MSKTKQAGNEIIVFIANLLTRCGGYRGLTNPSQVWAQNLG